MPPRRARFGRLTKVIGALAILAVVARLGYGFVADLASSWEVRSLTTQLSDPLESVAERAADRLEALGPKVAAPVFLEALHSDRPSTRRVACRHLPRTDVEPSVLVSGLVVALGDPDPDVQITAAHMFASPGSGLIAKADADESLREIALAAVGGELVSANEQVRSLAARSLGGFGRHAKTLARSLTVLLDDPSRTVRADAALALLKIDGQENGPALDTIARLLADPEFTSDLHEELMRAFRDGGPGRVDGLVSALIAQLKPDEPKARGKAMLVLTQTTPESLAAVPAIEAVLDDLKAHAGRHLEDDASSVFNPPEKIDHDLNDRCAFAAALLQIDPKNRMAVTTLSESIVTPTVEYSQRANAADALRLADPVALKGLIAVLIEKMKDPDPRASRDAARTLLLVDPESMTATTASPVPSETP